MSAYVLAQLSIHDRARYDRYAARFMDVLKEFDGRLLAADESPDVVEGKWSHEKPNDSHGKRCVMSNGKTYKGSCFCGAVQLTVTGEPAAMGYCHCGSCRHWSAGPVNAFSLWKPEAVKVTKGAENIGTYNKTPVSSRKWCKTCGGHVFTDHPPLGLIDVYAAIIPDFPHKPAVHVNYQEAVLRVRDGLPKLKDFPKEMGGSGESVPE